MTRDQIIEARQALVTQLPVIGEILRGSLRADRAPHQRLHDLRRRRRAPTVGSDHQLCRWPCSPATLTRQLARLRRLHVIKRVAGTYRYYLTRTGRATIAAGRRLTEHTIIPALA